VRERLTAIAAERKRKLGRLTEVSTLLSSDADAVDLLEALPVADAEGLRDASSDVLRRLFDAFRLTVTYDGCIRTPAQHGGMKADDARRLRGLGHANGWPKQIVSDRSWRRRAACR
jgi:hypothetical protein